MINQLTHYGVPDMKLRKWQSDALKVIKRTVKSNDKTIIPVNACVGSGKTFVAESAFGEFIKLHHNEKTVQLFVTPRVRLCDQQADHIKGTLAASFNLKEKADYDIVQVDYTKKDYDWRSAKLVAKHIIFVICDESLFGLDPAVNNAKVSRFNGWLRNFKKWQKQGYMFGFAAFDEAHNYENRKDYIINTEDSVNNFFKVMLLSGTPSAFQKDLTNLHHKNVCDCEPKVAIENATSTSFGGVKIASSMEETDTSNVPNASLVKSYVGNITSPILTSINETQTSLTSYITENNNRVDSIEGDVTTKYNELTGLIDTTETTFTTSLTSYQVSTDSAIQALNQTVADNKTNTDNTIQDLTQTVETNKNSTDSSIQTLSSSVYTKDEVDEKFRTNKGYIILRDYESI